MMSRIIHNCILLLLSCNLNIYSQDLINRDNCFDLPDNSYNTDGMDHQLVIYSNRFTRLNVIFLPQFKYRVIICNKNINSQVEIKFTDEKGNVLYSDGDFKEWDFQSDALLKGTFQLKLFKETSNYENISLIIGYKPIGYKF